MEEIITDYSKVLEGLKFMLLGMGTVFSFLILMIGAMNIQSYIIHKFFPEPVPHSDSTPGSTNTKKATKIAAIVAAIQHHKKG